ncbi:hypothetical protein [Pantanalinema sp. GBBB05]|uniref:hypothetical protein n=1 Tax=Pantanalinema sp. GBBB05 TaxID=2604139 RepID=UPI001DA296A5|nr:hypothetical protein [Pantanalinema sp. GBBB05]
MSYSAYIEAQPYKQTSVSAAASVPASVRVGSATFAACMLITFSTSVASPPAITPIKSATAQPPVASRSVFPIKETHRKDLKAIARIRMLGTYKAGWAGTESVGPSRSAVEHAEEFARYLFSLGEIHVPYISASGDGEINFYWNRDGFTLDLGFKGDGFYSYYALLPNGEEMIEDAASLGTGLPIEIVDLIVG